MITVVSREDWNKLSNNTQYEMYLNAIEEYKKILEIISEIEVDNARV